jgi:BTB/POZ domain/BTB And C-terminal Kelch
MSPTSEKATVAQENDEWSCTQSKSPPAELPLDKVLGSILSNEALLDVTLVGTEGVKVRANRTVLTARSEFFRRMFLGTFQEASSREITIGGLKGSVLQEVVDYIHTDTSTSFHTTKKRKANKDKSKKKEHHPDRVQSLVALSEAARYLNLPGLSAKVHQRLSILLREAPGLALVLFEICRSQGPAISESLAILSYDRIRDNERALKDAQAAALLSLRVVKELLNDADLGQNEYDLFCLLFNWVKADPHHRTAVAKDLTKSLRIKGINPVQLSTEVAPSGLVTMDRINDAYKHQALEAQKEHLLCFHETRELYVWETSMTRHSSVDNDSDSEDELHLAGDEPFEATDFLCCPPITKGIYQWTMELVANEADADMPCAFFGVVCKKTLVDKHSWIGEKVGSWGMDDFGVLFDQVCKWRR